MDLLEDTGEPVPFSENQIYISATKNTNMSILREMIKWKANRIMGNFPFRFVHHQREHQQRLTWLFENANFEDDSGTEFSFDRPLVFDDGFAFFDGYINSNLLREYQKHFGGGRPNDFHGFRMNWGEDFEDYFDMVDSGDRVYEETTNQMNHILDSLEAQIEKKNRQVRRGQLMHIRKKLGTESKKSWTQIKIEAKRSQERKRKDYERDLRNTFHIPKSWNTK
jgi:hypothetical protein